MNDEDEDNFMGSDADILSGFFDLCWTIEWNVFEKFFSFLICLVSADRFDKKVNDLHKRKYLELFYIKALQGEYKLKNLEWLGFGFR